MKNQLLPETKQEKAGPLLRYIMFCLSWAKREFLSGRISESESSMKGM